MTDKNRVFDLDRPLNKIEFDRVHANCLKLQKYSKRFSDVEMQEGVVINIMFQDMGYGEEYDIVIATFKLKNSKYSGIPMRLNFMSEKQICVKNLGIAVPIEFYDCNDKLENFHYCIDNLYYVTELEQTGTDSDVVTYSRNKRSSYQRRIYKKK